MVKSTEQMSKPKKALGQNFLVDKNVLLAFLSVATISPKDTVIEVGAGTGTITKELAKQAKEVLAVEIDKDIFLQLEKNVSDLRNVKIVNSDILKFTRLDRHQARLVDNYVVVGAIPYQITSPLIHKLLTAENPPKTITFIIQYEVAKKICAVPPNATYLSNFVSLYGTSKLTKKIKPFAFNPQPSVNSAIIHIEKHKTLPATDDMLKWSAFLHRGFKHPRKMLGNIFGKEDLLKAGIPPQKRAQELTLTEWENLYQMSKVKCKMSKPHLKTLKLEKFRFEI
ncbi:MAG: 16S rRNA (adenine(1518)-N(6)/adenine(1519)-N(6))-dimethyltransferase RsmA [Patescibacteria group bacterium]